jgi:putative ABC transport system permease protein
MAIIRLPWAFARLVAVSFALALGHIWTTKMRSVLTAIGIVIAVAAVIATIGALVGMQQAVADQFAAAGANRMDVWPRRPSEGPRKNAPFEKINFQPFSFENCLERCPAFTRLTRVCFDDQRASFGSRTIESVRLLGVDAGWGEIQNRAMISGRSFSSSEIATAQRVCCVTPDARDKLMLDRECAGQRIVIGNRTFLVIGVVEPEPQAGIVMFTGPPRPQIAVPYTTLHKGPNDWTEANLTVQSSSLVEEAEAQVKFFLRALLRLGPGEPDTFGVWNLEKNRESFNETSKGITAVAAGIVGISLVVGGIGIMNVMLVSVRERTREIGLRKAIGARPAAIMLQFLIEAVTLSLVGGVIGIAVGFALTAAVAAIPGSPAAKATIPSWAILISVAFAAATGIVSGMFPAIKAARLNPIEALRHE